MDKIYNKEIIYENNKYNITLINYNSSLQIKLSENEIKIYENSFSIEEIKQNKFFSIYETIEEILIDLIDYISSQKIKIKENEKENSLNLIIELPSKKVKEISFNLISKTKEENNIITNLNSEIIKENINENILLKSWIEPNKKIKAELLYRLTKDGESFEIFHKLCDGQKPNLILVKSKKGFKFGGFTFENWESCNEGKWKKDNKSFLFSLDLNKRYFQKDKNTNDNIYCLNIFGPCFSYDLAFKCKDMKKCTSWGKMTYLENKEMTHYENNNFDVEEVEVFKIII